MVSVFCFFFFKQKTAYEMRISDWSSDVCSSDLLLPRSELAMDEEGDPRAELVRRLQEYERFKQAAEDLDTLPRQGRDTSPAGAFVPDRAAVRLPPPVDLREMLLALHDVLKRAALYTQDRKSTRLNSSH